MGDLWDGLIAFLSKTGKWIAVAHGSTIIDEINKAQNKEQLRRVWLGLSLEERNDDKIWAAYEARYAAVGEPTVTGIYADLAKGLYNGFTELKSVIESEIGSTLESALKPGSPELTKVFEGSMDILLDRFITAIEAGGGKLSEDIKKKLKDTMKPALTLGLTFTVGSVLGELIHPTKELGLGHVSHFLYDTVGFKSLMGAYIEPIQRGMISTPLTYSINELTQPFLPSEGELTGLARKYEITKDDYQGSMKKLGIQQKYIDALYSGFWADPRLFEILRLMEVELPTIEVPKEASGWLERAGMKQYVGPNWWLAMKFGKAGYDQIDIPVLIKVVRARNLIKELGDIRTLNRNIYKDGGYTRAEYEEILAERGISKDESKKLIDAIDKEIAEEQNKVYRSAYEKKYLYGRITLDELKEALKKYGLTDKRIEARTEYLRTMKEGKLTVAEEEIKDMTKAEILKAYRVGVQQKGWALQRIDNQGYTTEDAVTLVNTEERGILDDTTAEWIRAYEQRTLNLRMTPGELEAKYIELGKDAGWAKGRATYFEERILGKEKIT